MGECDHNVSGGDLVRSHREMFDTLNGAVFIMAGGTGTHFWPLSTNEKSQAISEAHR